MNLDPYYELRRRIVDRLAVDLIGPESEEEVLTDPPITQYVAGVLYPATSGFITPDQHIDESDDYDETAVPDPAVSLASTKYPSSMGMTFAVADTVGSISVEVSAARYQPEDAAPDNGRWEDDDFISNAQPTRARRSNRHVWRRLPIEPVAFELDLTSPNPRITLPVAHGLELFARVRHPSGGTIPVTVALINRNVAPFGERDQFSFFQPIITAAGPADAGPVFVERHTNNIWSGDRDVQSNRLIYRHARSFAVGHGCSVTWNPPTGSDRADTISTTFQPEFDLLLADSNPTVESKALIMRWLASGEDRIDIVAELHALVADYRGWIENDQASKVRDLLTDLQASAMTNLDQCRTAADRMDRGVDMLATDDEAWEAFVLANRAMLEQRARSDWIRDERPEEGPQRNDTHQWRPFQLAFILQCLEGITTADSPDRPIADLLWFPTGGGKTEAYLGLIAFTAFHRRLTTAGGHGGGVTALMRYTLRLLTIQQFERAAILVCACEHLRNTYNREHAAERPDKLGAEPISIGLWVGQTASPNSRADAERALEKLRNGATLTEGNPIQLHSCAWCGTHLGPRNYYLNADRTRLVIDCDNEHCDFSRSARGSGAIRDGLPVYVIDEDIYDHRPTLIIATVDKFASLPWREQAANLFNLNDAEPPPQLIIQDELHLISGPLGTMTGLYETAVELLCTYQGKPPKIIASTATIRRADEHTRGLFGREILAQFPPPAIDARNSYFAVETPPDKKGTRLYVGVMAPGTSHATLMVRTYASLLQSVSEFDADENVKDPYWTLVGFFNSLRVLGGARMQVADDVDDRIHLLAAARDAAPREYPMRVELTSRESSADIPERLKQMAISSPNEDVIDVLLATNMISVGVDVERLGLMAVMGQPPSTSEYIQATSRVGRRYPGLIVTLFNASRSRDRSHYESFASYHSALYRQVEATSVTPFSPRARDRGLHAVVVALARMLVPEFRTNGGAASILRYAYKLDVVRDAITARVADTEPEAQVSTLRQYDELISEWRRMAAEHEGLVYQNSQNPDQALLVNAGSEKASTVDSWDTLWSLRDVDQTSNLYIVR